MRTAPMLLVMVSCAHVHSAFSELWRLTHLDDYQHIVHGLVVQFVAESRFANCEFANLFFHFDELQFSKFQMSNKFLVSIDEILTKLSR